MPLPVTSVGGGGGGGGQPISSGAYADLPAAGTVGNLYIPTDSLLQLYDDGAAWNKILPGFGLVTPPDSSDFTALNHGAATTVDETKGYLAMEVGAGSADNVRGYHKTAPSTPYEITIILRPKAYNINWLLIGGLFRQSSDGKLVTFAYGFFGSERYSVTQHPDATSSANGIDDNETSLASLVFLKIADDGTDRNYSVSQNGQNWEEVYTEGRTTYLTADQVGFFCYNFNGVPVAAADFLHWSEA